MGEAKRRRAGGDASPAADKLMADALANRIGDPDAAYPANGAFAFEIAPGLGPLLDKLPFLGTHGEFDEDHPIPLFLRLHAEGRGVRDVMATILGLARLGLREELKEPGFDPADEDGRARRTEVEAHIARAGDPGGTYDDDLAQFLTEMGYYWFNFHDDAEGEPAGAADYATLGEIAGMGGTLGQLARHMADLQDVEPYGIVGLTPGWGMIAYRGRGIYAIRPEDGKDDAGEYLITEPGTGKTLIRFDRLRRDGRSILFQASVPEEA